MEVYNVIEKFYSIDGEGPTAGQIATFIRFGGCNLRCSWCDTSYSTPKEVVGSPMTKEEIFQYIESNGTHHVTLTGGEPLIQSHIDELVLYLARQAHLTIHIETNGTISIRQLKEKLREVGAEKRVVFIIDYKLPGSQMEAAMHLENLTQVETQDVYKFVISNEEDLEVARNILEQYELTSKCKVYFSAVFGRIHPIQIVEFMKEHRMNKVVFQLQLHKFIWPPEARGV